MSEHDVKAGPHAHTPARRQDHLLADRRKTARHPLHDVRASVTWRAESGDVAREVGVLNVSGGGAALIIGDTPPAGQALRLNLHSRVARMDPIDAEVVGSSVDSEGRRVLHVRFTHWVPLDSLLQHHLERRMWMRYPARWSLVCLTWLEGAAERTIRGELLNISGGGAALIPEVSPPPGVPLRLVPDSCDRQIDPVESRLVTTSVDPAGRTIAHLQFTGPCPMDFFDLAVNGTR